LRAGLKLGQGKLEDWLWEGLTDPYAGCSMAITAENCAVKYGITREESDAPQGMDLRDHEGRSGPG
jgi:acetyl-CoA acetyltransferase